MQQIYSSLVSLGYEVIERGCSSALFADIRLDQPDVVFNLCSIYDWDKTYLLPGVLEIAEVRYTGSGILGLSLARNYSKLFPLLFKAGLQVPGFVVLPAGKSAPDGLRYPLALWRDGQPRALRVQHEQGLLQALAQCPAAEEVLLLEQPDGERLSLYLLDGLPILNTCASSADPAGLPCLRAAQQAYDLLEARGLARFDFIESAAEPLLEQIELAPDPMEEQFLASAAAGGWDKQRLLKMLVLHAARDAAAGG